MSSRSVAIRVPLLLALACVCACAHPAVRQTPSGVGVALVERGERPLVVELVPGGPAEAAGIAPGDALLSVDGRTTESLPIGEVIALLVGADATPVELEVARFPDGPLRRVSAQRARVHFLSAQATRLDAETLYLRLRAFVTGTAEDVTRILESERPASTLLLDLRANHGGELEPAVRTAELFLPAGAPIGSLEAAPARPSEARTWVSEGEPVARFERIFVLVNEDTAAGAELFCLALRANGIATLAGTRTHGHARVETRWPAPAQHPAVFDGTLRGPNGVAFDGVGIEPELRSPADPTHILPPASDPVVAWLRAKAQEAVMQAR
jgi:carboxyl-terminal processing protease